MGAASAVLLSMARDAQQQSALTLAAGKSSIGHTEPAAGMAGVMHALQAFQSQSVDPILHLRQVWVFSTGTLTSQVHSYTLHRHTKCAMVHSILIHTLAVGGFGCCYAS